MDHGAHAVRSAKYRNADYTICLCAWANYRCSLNLFPWTAACIWCNKQYHHSRLLRMHLWLVKSTFSFCPYSIYHRPCCHPRLESIRVMMYSIAASHSYSFADISVSLSITSTTVTDDCIATIVESKAYYIIRPSSSKSQVCGDRCSNATLGRIVSLSLNLLVTPATTSHLTQDLFSH